MLYCGRCKQLHPASRFKIKKNGEYQKVCQVCRGNTLDLNTTRDELINAISNVNDPELLDECITFLHKRYPGSQTATV